MDAPAQIGPSIVIKGEVSAQEDLIVAGHVEGIVHVDGHVLHVAAGGQVAADVEAKAIVVAGRVKGSLNAKERIELQAGSDIEGELAAPCLKMADGATFHGKVDMPPAKKLALAS